MESCARAGPATAKTDAIHQSAPRTNAGGGGFRSSLCADHEVWPGRVERIGSANIDTDSRRSTQNVRKTLETVVHEPLLFIGPTERFGQLSHLRVPPSALPQEDPGPGWIPDGIRIQWRRHGCEVWPIGMRGSKTNAPHIGSLARDAMFAPAASAQSGLEARPGL